jgi:WD40 repeat protein
MRLSRIGWFALAVVTTAPACGDRVLIGDQPSGLGSGMVPPSSPPVNQASPPTSPTTQPATQITTPPMPGTPPPSCPSTSSAQFVPAPSTASANGPVIFSLAYSPDGQVIAAGTAGPRPNVRLWNAADSTVLRDITGHGYPGWDVTYAVAFSPNSRILATAGIEAVDLSSDSAPGAEMVKLWDVASGSLLRVIPATCGFYADSLAFSHDGTLLVTSGAYGPIEIWRVSDGALMTRIPYPTTVYGVSFSSDDTRLLAAGMDRVATIWRVADGAKLLTLSGHGGEVADAVFSPDGKEIATASFDFTVGRWDAATGASLEMLRGHSAYLSRVRWIDRDHLASNDWNGTVILWTRDASGAFTRSCSLSTNRQSAGLDVSPDGTKLLASGASGPDRQTPGFWIFPL